MTKEKNCYSCKYFFDGKNCLEGGEPEFIIEGLRGTECGVWRAKSEPEVSCLDCEHGRSGPGGSMRCAVDGAEMRYSVSAGSCKDFEKAGNIAWQFSGSTGDATEPSPSMIESRGLDCHKLSSEPLSTEYDPVVRLLEIAAELRSHKVYHSAAAVYHEIAELVALEEEE